MVHSNVPGWDDEFQNAHIASIFRVLEQNAFSIRLETYSEPASTRRTLNLWFSLSLLAITDPAVPPMFGDQPKRVDSLASNYITARNNEIKRFGSDGELFNALIDPCLGTSNDAKKECYGVD